MICSAHQPDFIPYLGFFSKFKKCEIFVLCDNFQYNKNSWRNRNFIKTVSGPTWLNIPVSVRYGEEKINEVDIANNTFIKKHLKSIELNYKKAKYFNVIFPEIKKIYLDAQNEKKLVRINEMFLYYVFNIINPNIKIVKSSELNLDLEKKKTELVVEICKKVGATTFISGQGAKVYMDEKLFKDININLIWESYDHPVYPQLFGEFIPNMSVLDALFNVGPEGLVKLLN